MSIRATDINGFDNTARKTTKSDLITLVQPETTEAQETGSLFTQAMRLMEKVSGALLGGIAVSAQIANVLICLAIMILGPAIILGILAQ